MSSFTEPTHRSGMPPRHRSSSRSDLALAFSWLSRRTTSFTTIAIGRRTLNDVHVHPIDRARDALITSAINCATSILSGFVVFSTLGHMANVSKKTIEQVIEDKGEWPSVDCFCSVLVRHTTKNLRLGTGLHRLSAYDRADELVDSVGDSLLLHGHHSGHR